MHGWAPGATAVLAAAAETAALAARAHVGGGDKDAVDAAAVAAMRRAFEGAPVDARVVIGEGEKDAAPMLYAGERLGTGTGPALDIAVDPVDGTGLAARGEPGAISVIAAAPAGSLIDLGPLFYMEKLVCAGAGRELSLERPMAENLALLSAALGRPVDRLTVAVQERPRNRRYADAARAAGARVRLFADGDVVPALGAAGASGPGGTPDGGGPADAPDLLIGIGGAPESVVTAVAVRTLGGHMECRPAPQRDDERAAVRRAGIDPSRLLSRDDIAALPGCVVVTAVTDVPPLAAARAGTDPATESWVIEPAAGGARMALRRGPGEARSSSGVRPR